MLRREDGVYAQRWTGLCGTADISEGSGVFGPKCFII